MLWLLKSIYRAIYGWCHDKVDPFEEYTPSNLISHTIGYTTHDKPIILYQYWDDNASKTVLMNFGMHGNEIGTVKLAMKLLEALDTNSIDIPSDLRVLIIPCLNRDGFQKALKNPDYFWGWSVWKFNGNNVELVKNISLLENHSKKTKMRISGKMVTADWWDSPFSEPESQALRSVIQKIKPDLFIDYHNAYPCVWWETTSDAKIVAQKYRELTGRPDRSELYVTPDFKRYQSIWLNTIFVEWTNRWASDWNMHKRVLPEMFNYIVTQSNESN